MCAAGGQTPGRKKNLLLAAGWFANGIISILLVLRALKILKNHPAEQYYIMLLAMMPAVLISAASYTGMGILIALCALYWALCHNLYENGLQKGKAASAIILLIAIISVQYAYGVLVLLFIRVLQQNQGRKVQLWARITAGIAAAEMLAGTSLRFHAEQDLHVAHAPAFELAARQRSAPAAAFTVLIRRAV